MAGRLVIVGAGQAAFALAAKLRALKDERPITIIGSEDAYPYQRPPLSKKYLLGEMSFDRLMFRPEEWYAENNVDIRLSTFVEEIDRAAKSVRMQDGSTLSYDKLVLATGAAPRELPASIGGDLEGVLTVRDKRDADRLFEEMKPGRRLLVIGGGYIGLEAAAVARKLGLEVTLIEMADRILQRVAAKETADIMRGIHQAHGVSIREKTGLVRLVGMDGRVAAAELSDGSVLDVDFVIVGIGVTPNDRLARDRASMSAMASWWMNTPAARTRTFTRWAIARCCRGGASLCVSNQSRTPLIRPRPLLTYWQALKSPMMPNPGSGRINTR